jgi:hypothetical protein
VPVRLVAFGARLLPTDPNDDVADEVLPLRLRTLMFDRRGNPAFDLSIINLAKVNFCVWMKCRTENVGIDPVGAAADAIYREWPRPTSAGRFRQSASASPFSRRSTRSESDIPLILPYGL